jgi:hypothetical protein
MKHTNESKAIMSIKRRANAAMGIGNTIHTEEFKRSVSERWMGHIWNVGRKHGPECGHCKILQERNATNNPSKNGLNEETKKKMSEKKLGSKNNNAIMTEEKVIELRALIVHGVSMIDLANKYGIAVRTIKDIMNRKSWKHVL